MKNAHKRQFFTASRIASIAMFSALAGVLYALGFSIPVLFAPWLEMKFSDVPVLLGSFSLGAPSGAIIVVFRALIKLMMKNTSTEFTGEVSDILSGLALAIPAGLIYAREKTLSGAISACVAGCVLSVAVSLLANRYLIVPFYVKEMGWDLATLAQSLTPLYENITAETFYSYYLWLSVLPFNILRCLIASLLTFAVYKRTSFFIKKMSEKFDGKRGRRKPSGKAAAKKGGEGEKSGAFAQENGKKEAKTENQEEKTAS